MAKKSIDPTPVRRLAALVWEGRQAISASPKGPPGQPELCVSVVH
jgi:hypothetical protein